MTTFTSAKRTIRRTMVATALATAAVTVPVAAAQAASTVQALEVSDTGTLVAHGVAVNVPVTLTCTTGANTDKTGYLYVSLSQNRNDTVVRGTNDVTNVVCDEVSHTYEVLVRAQSAPLKKGPALVDATLNVCDENVCENPDVTQVIRVRA